MKALTALLPLTAAAPMVQKHNLTEPARRDFEPYDTIVFCEGELPLYPSHYVSLRGHPSCTGVQIIYDTCQLIPDSNRLGDDGSSFDIVSILVEIWFGHMLTISRIIKPET